MTPTVEMPTPKMPAPLPPVLEPQGKKPKQKSMQPTFLGAETVPQNTGSSTGKTLLGQ